MLKQAKYSISILHILLFSFSSCTKEGELEFPFAQLELSFFESFAPEERNLHLHLKTKEEFPCNNFLINLIHNTLDKQLMIEVDGLSDTENCVSIPGVATQQLKLGITDAFERSINLIFNDIQYLFDLQISSDKIQAKYTSDDFAEKVFFTYDSILRVPENYLWGFGFAEQAEQLNNFFTSIKEHEAQIHIPAKGNYYYFEVNEQQNMVFSIQEDIKAFGFIFEGEFSNITNILTEQYPELNISIYDSKGNKYIL